MGKSANHVYSIDLDITTPASSKQALKELQTAYSNSNNSMNELNKTYAEMSKYTKDNVELEKQYSKVIAKRLSDKDKEIDALKAEKVAIAANKNLTEQQREEMIGLKDAEIKRLETDKKYIKAKEKEAKLLTKMNKLFHSNLDENSKAFKLAKSTVAVQEKLNALLGKESKLRKAASKVASAGVKAGKVGLKAMGGAAAIGGAIVGAAAGAATSAADKERALGSLKSGIDPSIVDAVYVKSGADYSAIVAAVNNLSDVTKDNARLVQGAVLEIQNPGIGKLLLSQNKISNGDVSKLSNAITQIKKQTGIQDMASALEASTKARSVTAGKISQTEFLQAYAALSQMGMDEERIDRVIRNVAEKGGDFISNLNNEDLTKYVRGQEKNQLLNQKLGLSKLDVNSSGNQSSAQSVAEKLREFELKKNELLVKMLPVVDKVLETVSKAIEGPTIDKIANGLVKLFTAVLPLLEPILKLLEPVLDMLSPVVDWLSDVASNFIGTIIEPLISNLTTALKRLIGSDSDSPSIGAQVSAFLRGVPVRGASGGSRAQGGIISAPTLVGEAGPELVLPLDYSRAGRAASIINNFNTTQSFNMAANQQTPLAFSQAVGNNKFIQRINR